MVRRSSASAHLPRPEIVAFLDAIKKGPVTRKQRPTHASQALQFDKVHSSGWTDLFTCETSRYSERADSHIRASRTRVSASPSRLSPSHCSLSSARGSSAANPIPQTRSCGEASTSVVPRVVNNSSRCSEFWLNRA